jgi:DNA-binding response OmpR family regulator
VRAANREVSFGDFSVDLVGLTCYDGRRPVPVSAGYVQTLAMLVEHAPDVVGREALRSQMASLSDELPSTSRSVDVHISRIRRQLVLGGVTGLRIVHARGHGYRIVTSTGETR